MKQLRKISFVLFVLGSTAALWPQSVPTPSNSGPANAAAPRDRVRVSPKMAEGNLTYKVVPEYPEYAKANRIQGMVLLRVVIDKEGRVVDVKPVGGHRLLVDAATGAVRQWRYRPYRVDGQPVEVETNVTVNFNLAHL